jgi:hypothetical protein
MTVQAEVVVFLNDLRDKWRVFGILFRDDRGKNANTLTELEIRPIDREKVILGLTVDDYSEGPVEETLYRGSAMWVFGKNVKNREVYIKITMGLTGERVICISFHLAEYPIKYPFKQ